MISKDRNGWVEWDRIHLNNGLPMIVMTQYDMQGNLVTKARIGGSSDASKVLLHSKPGKASKEALHKQHSMVMKNQWKVDLLKEEFSRSS
jgi:hypothetical protein